MSDNAIETIGLTKKFGDFTAVDHLNLTVKPGELFGLLGPNGAGKTTIVRMLCTLIRPTEGTAIVGGYDLTKNPAQVRRQIGVVSEGVMLYKDLTVEENLKLLSRLYGLQENETNSRTKELLEMFDFREKTKRQVGALSSGWTKKALICAALLHNPKILFLDEVTSGLDPQSAISLRELTKALCRQGVTVIWTTHHMQEPEKICNRVGVVFSGRLIQVGTPLDLKRSASELSVVEVDAPNLSIELIEAIRGLSEVCNVKYDNPMLQVTCSKDFELAEKVTRILVSAGAKIRAINTQEPSLEEAFISLTGGEEEIDRFLESTTSK